VLSPSRAKPYQLTARGEPRPVHIDRAVRIPVSRPQGSVAQRLATTAMAA